MPVKTTVRTPAFDEQQSRLTYWHFQFGVWCLIVAFHSQLIFVWRNKIFKQIIFWQQICCLLKVFSIIQFHYIYDTGQSIETQLSLKANTVRFYLRVHLSCGTSWVRFTGGSYQKPLLRPKKLIISFSGTASLHFHMPHLSFYSVN